ncbi:MAG: hypothetical protein U0518_03920 [Candidatus Gracilibacteria bacterium]
MFERIILSLLGFAAGVALMKYRKQVYDFTGPFGWAERYMGSGGTATAIVLFGFASIVLSILYLFGYFQVGMPTDMQNPSTPTQNSVSNPISFLSSPSLFI